MCLKCKNVQMDPTLSFKFSPMFFMGGLQATIFNFI